VAPVSVPYYVPEGHIEGDLRRQGPPAAHHKSLVSNKRTDAKVFKWTSEDQISMS